MQPMEALEYIFLRVHRTTDWSAPYAEDFALIGFNALEALAWFGCAVYVLRRNLVGRRAAREHVYALLFVLFGLTDVVEVFQVSSPLIWIKLLILIPLFLTRRQVLATYTPRPRLV